MHNFAEFFRKYSRLMLFVLLLGISIFFIYKNNRYQRVLIFNAANETAGSAFEVYADAREYLNMRQTNRLLAEENAVLRAQLLEDKYKVYDKWVNSDTTYNQVYRYIPAQVINNSVDKAKNYVTLNVGRVHGVKPDMGIISPDGVVGVIKSVSEHFSVGISMLHPAMNVSGRFRSQPQFYGPITWQGTDENTLILDYIVSYAKIKPGDTVETNLTNSSIFPQGIPIGVVKSFEVGSEAGYYKIRLKPLTEFRKLGPAYVVAYTYKEEQAALEQEAKKGDEEE